MKIEINDDLIEMLKKENIFVYEKDKKIQTTLEWKVNQAVKEFLERLEKYNEEEIKK